MNQFNPSQPKMPSNANILRDYPVLIPYQVDLNTSTVGRHIRQSKRHVLWRFGFCHIPSVLAGNTGVACRGIEMDLHLVWSVASGKHLLYMNNVLIHQTFESTHVLPSQRFEHSFYVPEDILPGCHVIHITAWALGFGSRADLDKQFIMMFNGQSYSGFYPIYQLGSPYMRNKHARALASVTPDAMPRDGARSQEYQQRSNSNTESLLGNRPRRSDDSGRNSSAYGARPSAPSIAPNGLKPHDIAIDDRSEKIRIAEARLNSMRDMRMDSDQRRSGMYAKDKMEENNFIAEARLNSMRDLRRFAHVQEDEQTIHSFARPPPHARANKRQYHKPDAPDKTKLAAVQETKDLLDFGDDAVTSEPRFGLFRSSSSVTLDTAIRQGDDDMTTASAIYSHLDPNQIWKTQQNVSFRLQKPPVYADTQAGDLIQPTQSFSSQSHFGTGPSVAPPMTPSVTYAGRHMGFTPQQNQAMGNMGLQNPAPGPGPTSPNNTMNGFQAAPPPSWESLNAAFKPAPNAIPLQQPQRQQSTQVPYQYTR